jgi:BirA family biotin operon repressor/biotin-[acetyl-CoA-carboxylase] ligase
MDLMQFETLPLFSKPYFSWNLHTDYVGRRFVYRPSTESTMDDARRMLERFRLTEGALLLAETQTAGRGRAGRRWVSPPDVNLYFTLVLQPPPEALRGLAFITPLATARAAEATASKHGLEFVTELKWPNDLLVGGRKLAGTLIETSEDQQGRPVALVGVGINVNLDVAAYPEIAGIATSIRAETGVAVPREELLAAFCNQFEPLYEQLKAGSVAPFEEWRRRLVTLGHEVTASGAGETLRGTAVDVGADGALIIETAGGCRVRVEAGDVTLSARD